LRSKLGHFSSGVSPMPMLTPRMTSSMVSEPSLLQSPTQAPPL
jgi:hypothetical protein